MTRAGNAFRSGFSYGWFDSQGKVGTQYMLESVDLNGEAAAYAPLYAGRGGYRDAPRKGRSMMLADLAATGSGQAALPNATENSAEDSTSGRWLIAAT